MNSKQEPLCLEEWQFYKYADMLISKISIIGTHTKQYGFYQSTCANSAFPETWLPISRLTSDSFIHPFYSYFIQIDPYCDRLFDQHFVDYIRKEKNIFKIKEIDPQIKKSNKANAFMIQFTNTECMLLSYLIGGGYWKSAESFVIRKYINHYYSYELNRLKNVINETIRKFQNPQNITEMQQNQQSVDTINSFLSSQGGGISDYQQNAFNDYSIATEVRNEVSKLKIIRYRCNEYYQYLLTINSSEDTILKEKIKVMQKLCHLLDNNTYQTTTLETFRSAFLEHKNILTQRRDSTTMLFVKSILTILTLGLVVYFGIWSVKGENFQYHVDRLFQQQDIKLVFRSKFSN